MIRGFSLAIALVSVLALIPARAHTRDEVRAAYAAQGFAEIESRLIGEWRTGLFRAS